MKSNKAKGDGNSSTTFKMSDVRDYLFMRISDNDYTDEEYGFYLDIQQFGKKAVHMNWSAYHKVLISMKKEYNGL